MFFFFFAWQWEALALLLIGISINQLRSLPEGTTALGLPVATGAYIYTLIFVSLIKHEIFKTSHLVTFHDYPYELFWICSVNCFPSVVNFPPHVIINWLRSDLKNLSL